MISLGTIFWIVCCVYVAHRADKKGRSPVLWGLFAVLASPLIAWVVLLFMSDKSWKRDVNRLQREQEAIMDSIGAMTARRSGDMVTNGSLICPVCGAEVTFADKYCPKCGGEVAVKS